MSVFLRSLTISLYLAIALGFTLTISDGGGHIYPGGGIFAVPPINSVSVSNTWALYGTGACPGTKCISGDTFWNTWDDQGAIWTTADDTTVFNTTSSGCCNLTMNTLSDFSSSMTGTTVRTFVNQTPGFGQINQSGGDGATWKASSLISVQGMLILGATRQFTPSSSPPYADIFAASLWGSTDHAVTWNPNNLPACNGCDLGDPITSPPYTFTDPKFRWLAFFQYGQDYQLQTVDRSNQFVYALSADLSNAHKNPTPVYPTSDAINLGRITITALKSNPAASTASWQYYQGGDGLLDANWGALSTATPIFSKPGVYLYTDTPSPIFLPAFQQYLVITGSNDPGCRTGPRATCFGFYSANHPWGPWTLKSIGTWDNTNSPAPNGASIFYSPAFIMKSLSTDGGRHLVLTSSADSLTASYYTMYIVQVTVN